MYNRHSIQAIAADNFFKQAKGLKVKYSDLNTLTFFLQDFIEKCIIRQKRGSICTSVHHQEILSTLRDSGLGSFVATRGLTPALKDFKKSDSTQVSSAKINHSIVDYNFQALSASVKEIYKGLYTPVFGKKTYNDLLQYLALSNLECLLYIAPTIKLDHTTAEYTLLRNALKECISMKRTINDFDPFVNSSLKAVTESNIRLDSLHLMIEQLIKLKEKAEDIYHRLSRTTHELTSKWREEYELKYLEIISDKRTFELSFQSYISNHGESQVSEPGILSFSSEQKTRYLAWKNLRDGFSFFEKKMRDIPWVKLQHTDGTTILEMQDFTSKINEQLLHFNTDLEKLISIKLDRINFINSPHPALVANLENLEQCIIEFNGLVESNQKIEINTNSCLRHIQLCKKLILAIVALLKQYSSYPDTIRWRQAMDKLNGEHLRLLQEMQYFPIDTWEQHLEDYYFQSLKLKFYRPSQQMLPKEREAFFNSRKVVAQAEKELCFANAEMLRDKGFGALQTNDAKLYKRLIKNEPITPSEINVVGSVFPIFLNNIHSQNADVFITIHENEIYLAWNNVAEDTEVMTIDLEHAFPIIDKPLRECIATQKLNVARHLAKILLENTSHIRLFQLRTANVIACISENLFNHFLDALDESGVKETQCEDRKSDAIIEALIDTGRPQYLLVQDDLLNPEDIENLLWQKEIIDALASAGIQLINISSYALYREGIHALDNICTVLSGTIASEPNEQPVLQNMV